MPLPLHLKHLIFLLVETFGEATIDLPVFLDVASLEDVVPSFFNLSFQFCGLKEVVPLLNYPFLLKCCTNLIA